MSHTSHPKQLDRNSALERTSAEIGADGSGAVAIKMIHRDSTFTMVADVIRLIFSICLLIFSIISVFYAISTKGTTMPPSFPPWAQYVCLLISLFVLGGLEGLQISVVELAHKDPKKYEKYYPRAAKLLAIENKGRNVERFLMGRQVLVVFTVFIAARITTFDHFWADVPETMIHSLMFSGFLGVILVVVVAQLTPQVLASAYPVEFMNIYGINIFFWACLMLESTGIVHAVWFLCVSCKKLFWNCVCKHTNEGHDFSKIASHSTISGGDEYGRVDDMGGDMTVSREMLKTAQKAEIDIEEEVELAELNKKKYQDKYTSEFMANDELVNDQMEALLKNVQKNPDLFYIYGDQKYMSPHQCYEKFTNAGYNPPQFLLPPDHINHIPPHIVAMTLLKMYTENVSLFTGNKIEDV